MDTYAERSERAIDAILEEFMPKLMEHCDSIQVLISFQLPNGQTMRKSDGRGNWYASQGVAHEFINTDQAQNIANEIAKTSE